jgi:hypothetical protein
VGEHFAFQLHSQVPGSNTISLVLPPFTLVSGQTYEVGADFAGISDEQPVTGLPDAMGFAFFGKETHLEILAVPEPSTLLQGLFGLAALGWWTRRRVVRNPDRGVG